MRDPRGKIITAPELARQMRSGQDLVWIFTNGCFDILHRGHAEYLFLARTLGDRLVVGLNSDRSVRELKGPERPWVPEEDRALLLASLECVDHVVVFDEATPEALLALLRPGVHVKGGDYTPDNLPEGALVRSWGGRVEILPFLAGRSTSALVERIRGTR